MGAERPLAGVLALSSRLLPDVPVAEAARIARDLGYGGMEIWAEHAWRERSSTALARSLGDIPLRFALHGPSMDINLCSPNPRVAALSVSECVRALTWAKRIGVRLMVVHPGHMASSKGEPEEYWPTLSRALSRIVRRAAEFDITIAVENMEPRPREFVITSQDIQRVFESVRDCPICLCLDLAHAALNGMSSGDSFLRDHGGRICHVHISNVSGKQVHLPMDQGETPLSSDMQRFLTTSFTGVITLEGAMPSGIRTAEVGLARLRALLGGTKGGESPE